MNTLDRYIARQYLFNVVALFVLLFSFVVMIDVTLNLDRFLREAGRAAGMEDASGLRRLLVAFVFIADLWWPRLLQLFNYLNGLVLMGAMGFTVTQLVRHRELVAIMASGISLHRVAAPMVAVAVLMLGVQVLNQELVVSHPSIAPLLTRSIGDAGERSWEVFRVELVEDSGSRRFLGEFNASERTLTDVHVWERDERGVATRSITADRAEWTGDGWRLENGVAWPLTLAEAGAATGAGPRPIARIDSDLSPEALLVNQFEKFSESLSFIRLGQMIRSGAVGEASRERLTRIRYGRISALLCTLLALIITLPFFLTREPVNMVVQSLKSAPVGIIALMGSTLAAAWAVPGLPPGFAVFIWAFILLPIAVLMTTSLKT